MYVKYNRTFVMMEPQGSDFTAATSDDDQIKGYLKIETGNNKGAMRCIVQNLKPYGQSEYIYKLIFFGKKKERTIHTILGGLVLNKNGNGETYFRFDPLNFDGKGNTLDDFTVAIVAAASGKNKKESLHPVLKGTMEKEGDKKIVTTDTKDTEDQERESKVVWGDIKPNHNFNRFYNEYLLQFCDYTCKVADYYEDVRPFEKDKTGAMWKKMVNIGNLPLVSPGAHFFATHYKHYLFGAKPDENGRAVRYFFGIPGRGIEEERPDGGRSGFVLWQPMAGSQGMEKPYGYWILAIDGDSGNIEEA
ncbi:MAG: hypothetical protein ACOX4U_03385 [Anaerovoracaceae bacterium]|jgi:hypothetical protein